LFKKRPGENKMEKIIFFSTLISCFMLSIYFLNGILGLSFVPSFFGSLLTGIFGATKILN